jgi:hypothetical protein
LDCTRIHKTLQALVLNGPQPVHPGIIDMLKRNRDQEGKGMLKLLHSEFSWQLLHGRRGDPENGRILSKAATILLVTNLPSQHYFKECITLHWFNLKNPRVIHRRKALLQS